METLKEKRERIRKEGQSKVAIATKKRNDEMKNKLKGFFGFDGDDDRKSDYEDGGVVKKGCFSKIDKMLKKKK